MKILFALLVHFYLEAYVEYIIRYFGEHQIDLAVPSDLARISDYPEGFQHIYSLAKHPEDYDLIVDLFQHSQRIDMQKYGDKVVRVVWNAGNTRKGASFYISTTEATDVACRDQHLNFKRLKFGTDTRLFCPFPQWKKEGLNVGVVGRLNSPMKKMNEIVMQLIDIPGVNILLFADDDYPQVDIDRNGGKDMVTRIVSGKKYWTGMPNIYNQMDVLLEPDVKGDIKFPILDAGACGVPAVTGSTGFTDIPGFILDDFSVPSIRNALIDLRDNPDKIKRLGMEAREKVVNDWSWEAVIGDWRDFFKLMEETHG